ncbi:MAG: four helix bundle protein [Caldilineaceae bacterium]
MAYEALEDLEIFRIAEQVCDRFYTLIQAWKAFDKETVGMQLVRAADSIGANFAESYGRYHYGEKLNFLYYARGSLYETKYWIRRCRSRQLLDKDVCDNASKVLTDLGIKLNAFINDRRDRRSATAPTSKTLAESSVPYEIDQLDVVDEWLDLPEKNLDNHQSTNHQLTNTIF